MVSDATHAPAHRLPRVERDCTSVTLRGARSAADARSELADQGNQLTRVDHQDEWLTCRQAIVALDDLYKARQPCERGPVLSVGLSNSADASPRAPLGVLGVLFLTFGLGNLVLRLWAERRLRAGRTLPRPFRTLRLFVTHPKLFFGALLAQITIGILLLATAIATTDR